MITSSGEDDDVITSSASACGGVHDEALASSSSSTTGLCVALSFLAPPALSPALLFLIFVVALLPTLRAPVGKGEERMRERECVKDDLSLVRKREDG